MTYSFIPYTQPTLELTEEELNERILQGNRYACKLDHSKISTTTGYCFYCGQLTNSNDTETKR
jgi:hypothetical protein